MLFNSFIHFFIIISHQFLFPFTNAIPLVEDKMIISFMRNDQKMQISDYSMQKYETHLGIVYYMRKNWQCDKISEEFEEYERTECQKYRKYLEILYEYLYREYLGIPTVKPKIMFKMEIEIEGPIIYAVNCLVNISQFYFTSDWNYFFDYKLKELFDDDGFKPKLLNEQRLNYEFKLENESKLSINEMILELAIETANNYKTNESTEGIIQQKFEQNLEEKFKKAEERAKKEHEEEDDDEINDDKHLIIKHSIFDDELTWIEDTLISEFVKGLATNFEKFFKTAQKYSNYLYHEAHLGVIFLMKKNWHCEKFERTECQKYRKYLDILYEYLFRLYVEAKNPNVLKQLPPLVKPIFIEGEYTPHSLNDVIKNLNDHSKFFWKKDENAPGGIKLVNEEELNFEIKGRENEIKEQNLLSKSNQFEKEKIKRPKNVKKRKESLNGEPKESKMKKKAKISSNKNEIDKLWEEFDIKMEEICEKTKENAKEEKEKLEKALTKAKDEQERETLEFKYNYKFGIFISSPFS